MVEPVSIERATDGYVGFTTNTRQHDREILTELLGLDGDAIARLKKDNLTGDRREGM